MIANEVESCGVMVVRTAGGVGVAWSRFPPAVIDRPITVRVGLPGEGGRVVKEELLNPLNDLPWRDYYGHGVDHTSLRVVVLDGERVLAELPSPDDCGMLPFMKLSGPQVHVTESYVCVPPALTVTDERGDVWTLGLVTAPKEKSPEGEFAFAVLKNGFDCGEVASRIEKRGGRMRILTRAGWKFLSSDGSFFL